MPGTKNRDELTKLVFFLGVDAVLDKNKATITEDEALLLLSLLNFERYVTRHNFVPKSREWWKMVCFDENYDESRFRSQFRMSREAFNFLAAQIEDNAAFNEMQEPVYLQLGVALYRFGTYGNSSSVQHVATKFGISEGAVVKFTNRVIQGIMSQCTKWIQWPSAEERKQIGSDMALKCLPKCVGYVDGTDVIFSDAPIDSKEVYWSRKKRYCMQLQIICDNDLRIRDLFTGYPGSVHDAKVYAASPTASRPQNFFSEGEFVIGDSAYTLSETVITPYRKTSDGLTQLQKSFNWNLSHYRVAVENTIGILKGRFQSLKGLRIKVSKSSGHKRACEWILACAILHNMLCSADPWEVEEGDGESNEEPVQTNYSSEEKNKKGKLKRQALFEIFKSVNNL